LSSLVRIIAIPLHPLRFHGICHSLKSVLLRLDSTSSATSSIIPADVPAIALSHRNVSILLGAMRNRLSSLSFFFPISVSICFTEINRNRGRDEMKLIETEISSSFLLLCICSIVIVGIFLSVSTATSRNLVGLSGPDWDL
jgi:hypothetical protein